MDAENLKEKLHPETKKERKLRDRIDKYRLAIRIGVFVALVLSVITFWAMINAPQRIEGAPTVCFKHDNCFNAILVTTPEEQAIGLQNYSRLPKNKVMIFIFSRADVQNMWMRDMQFPIDIIWVDKRGRIGHIEKEAVPCRSDMCEIFSPPISAKYVIETEAGFAEEYSLFNSDTVVFENIPE